MRLHGRLADTQLHRDLLIALAAREQRQDLQFSGAQGFAAQARGKLRHDRRRNAGLAGVDLADAVEQLLALRVLQDVALCAGLDRPGDVVVGIEGGQTDDARRRVHPADLADRGHAVHDGHPQIDQHYIGAAFLPQLDGLAAGRCLPGHAHVGLAPDDCGKSLPYRNVVVGDQNPNAGSGLRLAPAVRHAAHAVSGSGSSSVATGAWGNGKEIEIAEPEPKALVMANWPPIRSTRSRMPRRPNPSVFPFGSKPAPSSRRSRRTAFRTNASCALKRVACAWRRTFVSASRPIWRMLSSQSVGRWFGLPLPTDWEDNILQIGREALTNVLRDRKSTRLNSRHANISSAYFSFIK